MLPKMIKKNKIEPFNKLKKKSNHHNGKKKLHMQKKKDEIKPAWKPSGTNANLKLDQTMESIMPRGDTRYEDTLQGSPAQWTKKLDGVNWIQAFRPIENDIKCARSLKYTFSKDIEHFHNKHSHYNDLRSKKNDISQDISQTNLHSPTVSTMSRGKSNFTNTLKEKPISPKIAFQVPSPCPLALNEENNSNQPSKISSKKITSKKQYYEVNRPQSAVLFKKKSKNDSKSSSVQNRRPSSAYGLLTNTTNKLPNKNFMNSTKSSTLKRATQHTISSTNLASIRIAPQVQCR